MLFFSFTSTLGVNSCIIYYNEIGVFLKLTENKFFFKCDVMDGVLMVEGRITKKTDAIKQTVGKMADCKWGGRSAKEGCEKCGGGRQVGAAREKRKGITVEAVQHYMY